jgi:hypothetical protein
MSIKITISSKKLGRQVTFVARDSSGYVFVDPSVSWGKQLFDRHGNAFVARSEEQLRRIARQWIKNIYIYG